VEGEVDNSDIDGVVKLKSVELTGVSLCNMKVELRELTEGKVSKCINGFQTLTN
jgi:hypothetical protein